VEFGAGFLCSDIIRELRVIGTELRFFDCNVFFGTPAGKTIMRVPTADDLLAELDRAGIERALAWHIAQHDASPWLGNGFVSEATARQPRLTGCWTILPNQAHEFPPPAEFIAAMAAARIGALRAFPASHKYLLNGVAMGDWLDRLVERRVPLFLSLRRGIDWPAIYSLLAEFPRLVCVICDHGPWGADRLFRPLVERYPDVYIELSQYMLDGGIEALVTDYGPERVLFGSGYPESYMGGMMLALKHSRISSDAKQAIAGGNLERILAWAGGGA
jgi:uncharacterized protein